MELEQPSLLGVPKMLRRDCLPTKRDIFDHYLYMRKARQESGEWKQNTPLSIAVGEVLTDVREQWDKTGIPPFLGGRKGEKDITSILMKAQSLTKVPLAKRGEDFGSELDILYDAAVCHHSDFSACSCPLDKQASPRLILPFSLNHLIL